MSASAAADARRRRCDGDWGGPCRQGHGGRCRADSDGPGPGVPAGLLQNWRGRLGLSPVEQLVVLGAGGGGKSDRIVLVDMGRALRLANAWFNAMLYCV
jgi:hypothetical protein